MIEAAGCNAASLRDVETLREVFARLIKDLDLKIIGEGAWHKFGGEGGVTGLVMLTESHIACHTYPEHFVATFNLYCCRVRPEWNWTENLREMLGAESVSVRKIERGEIQLKQAVKDNKNFVGYGDVKIRDRGILPHWEKEDGIYFVTFRLADSLPQKILRKIEAEREQTLQILEKLERELSDTEKSKVDWLFSEKVDGYLDEGFGECHLKNPEIAEIAADALRHFDNQRYQLFSWCIMPNHVHVVFRAIRKNELEDILHSWKSFTANKINKILGKSGEFWQREYIDRLVRDQEEFENIIQYILDNPVKAGLKNWKWIWSYEKYKTSNKSA